MGHGNRTSLGWRCLTRAAPTCDMFNLWSSYFHILLTAVRHLLNVTLTSVHNLCTVVLVLWLSLYCWKGQVWQVNLSVFLPDVPALACVMHLRTCLTTYIWSRKGLDVACARLPTDRVLFHAHTTHSVTEVSLSRGPVSGIAFQDTRRGYHLQQLQAWTQDILVFLQPGRNVTSCLIARYKCLY